MLVSFYTSEMNTHSYIPFLFSINFLFHLSIMLLSFTYNAFEFHL